MCNIAGYAGTRPAAPILIDILRREEGFWAGYYTGIATFHEGKIHYRKVMGDLDLLLETTDACDLPGTIGIIHGRSKAGGDGEWAHPFIGEKNGVAEIAYIANGSNGWFADQKQHQSDIAQRLDAAGYKMSSRAVMSNKGYPSFPDGTSVHVSDVMCQLILSKLDEGMDECDAMSAAFCEMPAEIVGLMLSRCKPDAIFYSRINEPMFVGFADHGTYLATAHIAFPDDAAEPALLPTSSSGVITRDTFTVFPYKNPPTAVTPITAEMYASVYGKIIAELTEGEKSFPDLWKATKPILDKFGGCNQIEPLLYDIVSDLLRGGKAEYSTVRVPGQTEDLDAPQFMLRLK